MSEDKEKMDSKTSSRLDDLLDYVYHVGQINQKPIFRIEEYKQLNIWEHELKGKIGIQHNIIDTSLKSVFFGKYCLDKYKRKAMV